MNNIIIVRHGQDEDNKNRILNGRRNTKLTILGIRQAESVSGTLRNRGVDLIYSSPLDRAYETATIIAKNLNIITVKKDKALIERDFGVLTGKPIADISKYAKETLEINNVLYFLQGEEVETFPEVLVRAKEFMQKISTRHSNKTILLLTHGDVGKMIYTVCMGKTWQEGLYIHFSDNVDILKTRY